METAKLAITCGLPLSGKSTLAKTIKSAYKYIVVNPDTVRLMLHGQQFIKSAEDFVWANVKLIVRTLLASGYNVLVDATNITIAERKTWIDIAKEFDIDKVVVFKMDIPHTDCFERNEKIHRLDESIISKMYYKFEEPEIDKEDIILSNVRSDSLTTGTYTSNVFNIMDHTGKVLQQIQYYID